MSVREAATMLEVSESTIRRMLHEGELESKRLRPRGWHRITRRSVEARLQ